MYIGGISLPRVPSPVQHAVFAELASTNLPSFFALLKAARRAQYRYVTMFFREGAFSLLGIGNQALKNIYANLRFR